MLTIFVLQYCVEFRQWKKELERARFAKVTIAINVLCITYTSIEFQNDNPLFQKATEDFVNPAYGK